MKIGMVIVTYNRKEKLVNVLRSIEQQDRKPDVVVLVDNCSTDGTDVLLREWERHSPFKTIVFRTEKNLGGAGGFAKGIEIIQKENVDWVYLGDDDAYPSQGFLSVFSSTVDSFDEKEKNVVAICAKVVGPQGICLGHRRTIEKRLFRIKEISASKNMYEKPSFYIDCFSFVGVVIRKDVLVICGLPRADFFIWYDDTEYALRVKRYGKICCVPMLEIFHDTIPDNGRVSWKTYYGIRNRLEFYRVHFGKRYANYYAFRRKLESIKRIILNKSTHDSKLYYRILKEAYRDYRHNRFGVSERFKPGAHVELNK